MGEVISGGTMRTRFAKKAAPIGGVAALLAGAVVMQANGQTYQPQLLLNGGFESPASTLNPNTVVSDWSLYGSAVRANYEDNTPGGERSIWLETFKSFGGVYQNAPVVAGT